MADPGPRMAARRTRMRRIHCAYRRRLTSCIASASFGDGVRRAGHRERDQAMAAMTDRRCVISGCREIGEHLDDCTSDRCKGCRPRAVERGLVCNSDRTGLAAMLTDIRELDGQLREDPDPIDHQDWVLRPVPTSDPRRLPPWRWMRTAGEAEDALARVLPMGIVKSGLGAGARVSGSREPAALTDLDRLDLTASPRAAFPSAAGRANKADQVGHLSVAADLDLWVRDWRDELFPGQHLPAPTVPALVGWLENRLEEACDRHRAVDEFAEAIRDLRTILRRKLGLNAPPKTLCKGVACKACDLLTLYREGGLISCGNCGLNYSDDEYRKWVGMLNAETIQRLRSGDLAMPDDYEVTRLVA